MVLLDKGEAGRAEQARLPVKKKNWKKKLAKAIPFLMNYEFICDLPNTKLEFKKW